MESNAHTYFGKAHPAFQRCKLRGQARKRIADTGLLDPSMGKIKVTPEAPGVYGGGTTPTTQCRLELTTLATLQRAAAKNITLLLTLANDSMITPHLHA